MRTFAILAALLAMTACATIRPPQTQYSQPSAATTRTPAASSQAYAPAASPELSTSHARLTQLKLDREKKQATASIAELAELNNEIAALELRVAELESGISSSATPRPGTDSATATTSGGQVVHTGPRGGEYVITKSGNKRYIGKARK
jgi:hypothetical protein